MQCAAHEDDRADEEGQGQHNQEHHTTKNQVAAAGAEGSASALAQAKVLGHDHGELPGREPEGERNLPWLVGVVLLFLLLLHDLLLLGGFLGLSLGEAGVRLVVRRLVGDLFLLLGCCLLGVLLFAPAVSVLVLAFPGGEGFLDDDVSKADNHNVAKDEDTQEDDRAVEDVAGYIGLELDVGLGVAFLRRRPQAQETTAAAGSRSRSRAR
mmetsp:Transcript_11440/g.26019  ORF Transcript_11440/g.26019 Transcript_11440/m.26019 type:complete len:210 (+) Transcript_11440:2130-2759(+)